MTSYKQINMYNKGGISIFICHIFNECIEINIFPIKWKTGVVLPFPKKPNPSEILFLISLSMHMRQCRWYMGVSCSPSD